MAHRQNVASLNLFYRYYFGRCSSKVAKMVPFPYSHGRSICYCNSYHHFLVAIPRFYKDFYINNLFLHTARLWNFLSVDWPLLTYNLSLELISTWYLWVLPYWLFYMLFIFVSFSSLFSFPWSKSQSRKKYCFDVRMIHDLIYCNIGQISYISIV